MHTMHTMHTAPPAPPYPYPPHHVWRRCSACTLYHMVPERGGAWCAWCGVHRADAAHYVHVHVPLPHHAGAWCAWCGALGCKAH